jgi:tetratricopeptide (TPR) repeat protein
MKPRRALFTALATAAFQLLGATAPRFAHADTPPSGWDIAKDPAARERYELHVLVRDLVSQDPRLLTSRGLRLGTLDRARALLEDSGAATSPDVRLRFDLGEVYEALDRHQAAITVLTGALKDAPDHPASESAWVVLAYAYAKLDKPKEERDAYEKYLALTSDDRSRATAILNLAEAEMRLGHIDDAVAGYREAVQLAAALPSGTSTAVETGKLAVWGLAVALDRAGDATGSAVQAKLAVQMDMGLALIGQGQNVFFVPPYERLWYLALGTTVEAKAATDPRKALESWRQVEKYWDSYVEQAERGDPKDRWLPRARAHRDQAHAERAVAEKRAAKAPPVPRAPPEPLVF